MKKMCLWSNRGGVAVITAFVRTRHCVDQTGKWNIVEMDEKNTHTLLEEAETL